MCLMFCLGCRGPASNPLWAACAPRAKGCATLDHLTEVSNSSEPIGSTGWAKNDILAAFEFPLLLVALRRHHVH